MQHNISKCLPGSLLFSALRVRAHSEAVLFTFTAETFAVVQAKSASKTGKKINKNALPKIAWCPSPEDKRGSTTYVLWTKANELLVFCRPRGATKLLYPTSTTVCNFHSGYICQQCQIRYETSTY